MSRRKSTIKRQVSPDYKYKSEKVSKFINIIMKNGKKMVAQKIIYSTLSLIEKETKKEPLKVLYEAIENTTPAVEVRSRRIGGSNYQVPVEVNAYRGLALSMRWLKEAAQQRKEKSMIAGLYKEIIDATEKKGNAIKKKEEAHRMAESNRAFSHYRW